MDKVKNSNKNSSPSSPESVRIYRDWCKKCGVCIAFCPKEALEQGQEGYPALKDNHSCNGCGLCELLCPDFAIVVQDEKR